jgi:hypothetical protein
MSTRRRYAYGLGRLTTPIATAAATTAAATASATAKPAAATATAATPTAVALAFLSLVDADRAAHQLVAVELLDRSLRLGIRGHLDEPESARLTRHPIRDDRHGIAVPDLRKDLLQILLPGLEGQITDVQLSSHV